MDSLAFETLTPKAIVKRYVSLLLEHKRIILSGPAGTGKTFMANRYATRSDQFKNIKSKLEFRYHTRLGHLLLGLVLAQAYL